MENCLSVLTGSANDYTNEASFPRTDWVQFCTPSEKEGPNGSLNEQATPGTMIGESEYVCLRERIAQDSTSVRRGYWLRGTKVKCKSALGERESLPGGRGSLRGPPGRVLGKGRSGYETQIRIRRYRCGIPRCVDRTPTVRERVDALSAPTACDPGDINYNLCLAITDRMADQQVRIDLVWYGTWATVGLILVLMVVDLWRRGWNFEGKI